jgi:hypothetical protein
MPYSFEARGVNLSELLSGPSSYRIPAFQRPYAWEEGIAAQLFDDIQYNYINDPNSDYFIGTIMLSKSANTYDVIDGQQRLINLCIILSVLRDLIVQTEKKKAIHNRLWITDGLQDGPGYPRVNIRSLEEEMFSSTVMQIGGTQNITLPPASEPSKQIRDVTQRILADLANTQNEYLVGVTKYILEKCEFIKVVAPNNEAGYRLFKSVNSPGKALTEFDIVRSQLLGSHITDPQNVYKVMDAWNTIEQNYGSKELGKYLSVIAATVIPDGMRHDLFRQVQIISDNVHYKSAFYTFLESFFKNYRALMQAELALGTESKFVNRAVKCLLAQPDRSWMPVALKWLAKNNSSHDAYKFFKGLDALLLGMTILSCNKSTRAKRLTQLMKDVEFGTVLKLSSSLYLTISEKRKIREIVSGEMRSSMTFLKPLLLRLNAEFTPIEAEPYFPRSLTLEHILPRKPSENSKWREHFTQQQRLDLTNKLGNLTLLTEAINAKASNSDWAYKKEIIFNIKTIQAFPITMSLKSFDSWTPKTILERHSDLLHTLDGILAA